VQQPSNEEIYRQLGKGMPAGENNMADYRFSVTEKAPGHLEDEPLPLLDICDC
jgi:hypothetical protein